MNEHANLSTVRALSALAILAVAVLASPGVASAGTGTKAQIEYAERNTAPAERGVKAQIEHQEMRELPEDTAAAPARPADGCTDAVDDAPRATKGQIEYRERSLLEPQ